MFELHKTKDGDILPICQMTDQHLINTISFICKKIEEARLVLKQTQSSYILLEVKSELVDSATKVIKHYSYRLLHYVLEANLRGLDIKDYLQLAYDRKEQIDSLQEAELPKRRDLKAEYELSHYLIDDTDDTEDRDEFYYHSGDGQDLLLS